MSSLSSHHDRPSSASIGEGRTVELSGLPPATSRELATALGPRGVALLASPDRFVARERILVGLTIAGALALFAIMARAFAAPCEPQHEASFAVIYALPLAPLALLVVRWAMFRARAARMPFAPGVYVLERDVVIAHGPALRIVPLASVAAVGAPRRLPLGGVAEITLWIEGEPAETCAVPAATADEVALRIEKAREDATAPPTATPTRRRHDALAELRRGAVWERAPRERPRGSWAAAVGIAIPIALGLGAVALVGRNLASDALALDGALAVSDVDALRCYAEAGGRHAVHVQRELLPRAAYQRAIATGDAAALGEYVEAFPDGPDTPLARERWIAMEYESARTSAWSLRAFVSRFPDAPQSADAHAALPRLALDDAIRSGDAAAYTFVMHAHAGTPEAEEARRRRHARYEDALASLTERGGRPEVIAFLRALFAYLEAHDGPAVAVRFRTPSDAALRRFDALVARTQNDAVEPIAPSFSRRLSMQREAIIFDRLHAALEPLVPRDVLRLGRGANLPEQPSPEDIEEQVALYPEEEREAARAQILERAEDARDEPEIRIDYVVEPSGAVYEDAGGDLGDSPLAGLDPELLARLVGGVPSRETRRFAGFLVTFVVEMRIPDAPERHSFVITVQPDDSISIEGGTGAPSDATVYEVLATTAFDRLGTELTAAFVGRAPPFDAAPPSDTAPTPDDGASAEIPSDVGGAP